MATYNTPNMEELLDAGVHFGHQVKRWHPGMEKYIFAQRMGIHVIDLEQTETLLKKACDKLYKLASEGGHIVFVGTKRQANTIVKAEAERSGAFYVNERWLGGTITNFPVISKNIKKLVNLKNRKQQGEFERYTKKERLLLDRQIEKLERLIGGIVGLRGKPAAIFIVDARREKTAIREANASNVPVIALLDTNTDPSGVDYVIPGNDDAIRSIALVVKSISDSIQAGYTDFAASSKKPDNTEQADSEVDDVIALPVVVSGDASAHASEVTGKKLVEDTTNLIEDLNDLDSVEKDAGNTATPAPKKKSKAGGK